MIRPPAMPFRQRFHPFTWDTKPPAADSPGSARRCWACRTRSCHDRASSCRTALARIACLSKPVVPRIRFAWARSAALRSNCWLQRLDCSCATSVSSSRATRRKHATRSTDARADLTRLGRASRLHLSWRRPAAWPTPRGAGPKCGSKLLQSAPSRAFRPRLWRHGAWTGPKPLQLRGIRPGSQRRRRPGSREAAWKERFARKVRLPPDVLRVLGRHPPARRPDGSGRAAAGPCFLKTPPPAHPF